MKKNDKHKAKESSANIATICGVPYLFWVYCLRWWIVPLLNLIPGININKKSGPEEYFIKDDEAFHND